MRALLLATLTVLLLGAPASALAAVGDECLTDEACDEAAGERCVLEIVEQTDFPCLEDAQCRIATDNISARCKTPDMCGDENPLECENLRKCFVLEGTCAGAAAATASAVEPLPGLTKPKLQIELPDLLEFSEGGFVEEGGSRYVFIPWISEYFRVIYLYFVGIAGLVAVIVFIHAGLEWMASGGNSAGVESAKTKIRNATLGLAILFGSYTILFAIDPSLVSFGGLRVEVARNIPLDFKAMEDTFVEGDMDTAGAPPRGHKNVPLIKQAAAQWRSMAYGDKPVCPGGKDPGDANPACCSSYAYAACGPTTLSMILSAHQVEASPIDTGAFAVELGDRTCNTGTRGKIFSEVGKKWSTFTGIKINHEKALELLSSSAVAPLAATTPNVHGKKGANDKKLYKSGGHWIVLTSANENFVYVNDPATGGGFVGRPEGYDGFWGRKGPGLEAMSIANFRKIPKIYFVGPHSLAQELGIE